MRRGSPTLVVLGIAAVASGCPRMPLRPRTVDDAVARGVTPVRGREDPEDAAALANRLWASVLSGGLEPNAEARRRIATELVPLLCARLSDPDPRVRVRAAESLSRLGHADDQLRPGVPAVDVDAVLRAAADPELARSVVVLRLVDPLPSRAIAPLEARVDVGDSRAAGVLADAGPTARRGLLPRTAGPEPGAAVESDALARVALDGTEVRVLLDGVETADERVSRHRWAALANSLGSTFPAWERVVACLNARFVYVRRDAARALRFKGRDPVLARRLHAIALRERETVYVEALGRLGPAEDMAPSLAEIIRDGTATPESRGACLRALGRLGPRARGYLSLVRSRVYDAQDLPEINGARDALDWIQHGPPP